MFRIHISTYFPSPELSPMDGITAGTQKDEVTLRIVVRMPPQHIIKGVSTSRVEWGEKQMQYLCISATVELEGSAYLF